jgi:hypothetical protein
MGPVTAGLVKLCASAGTDAADKKTDTDNARKINLFISFPPSLSCRQLLGVA